VHEAETRRRFWRIAAAGVFFQGGAAAADSSTIVAALVHALTGSAFAVGATAAIGRYGWLFPQLFVGWLAQSQPRRLPLYMAGAFGRVACLAAVAALLVLTGDETNPLLVIGFFTLWTAYAFVSGIVAVPYNDIVGRSVASTKRSRISPDDRRPAYSGYFNALAAPAALLPLAGAAIAEAASYSVVFAASAAAAALQFLAVRRLREVETEEPQAR